MTASVQFTVMADGVPIAVDPATTVNIQFFAIDGITPLTQQRPVTSTEGGANWPIGVVGIALLPDESANLLSPESMLVIAAPNFVKRFRVTVDNPSIPVNSALFNKDFIITELRQSQLLLLAQNYFPNVTLTDSFLWDQVKAAESKTSKDLRVRFQPTQFFPLPPTPAQINALPPGMPWAVDAAYDYDQDFFWGEKWGMISARQIPIISIQSIIFAYPAPTTGFFTIPNDWVRMDQKYGHIRLIPASNAGFAPLSAFVLQALSGSRSIPFAIQITYTAGLSNPKQDYPELLNVVKRRAMLNVLNFGFLPQSGSISADGLSESTGFDIRKFEEGINEALYGMKGSNGGLMTALHGVRSGHLF